MIVEFGVITPEIVIRRSETGWPERRPGFSDRCRKRFGIGTLDSVLPNGDGHHHQCHVVAAAISDSTQLARMLSQRLEQGQGRGGDNHKLTPK